MRARVGDQFRQRVRRKRRVGDQDERAAADAGHGDQVIHRIVGQPLDRQGRAGQGRCGREQDRVAVGFGPDDLLGGDGAAGAGAVLHDDRLFQLLAQLLRQHARHGVGTAARRIADDHADGFVGPGVGGEGRAGLGQRDQGSQARRRGGAAGEPPWMQ
ncbi:hypothetical protein D9M68_760470 [compost metagenome]